MFSPVSCLLRAHIWARLGPPSHADGKRSRTMSFIAATAQFMLSLAIVVGGALLLLIAAYKYIPSFERSMNDAFLFPAAAAQRRGVWVHDTRYWEYVSPKDHIAPRGCDQHGRPPFDQQRLHSRATEHPHRRGGGSGLHKRGALVAQDDVPLLVPS